MSVILHHAGADWLPGGFVGVDVFFVISGFLISSMLLREMDQRQFSVLRFYERRARRILPALLFMLLITVPVFQFIALPAQALGTAEAGLAALLSVSNLYFWSQTGYFAPTAEFLPLLHTWSLAVEEQFYLLFPLVLVVLRQLRMPVRWLILIGMVLAFAVGFWLSHTKPSVAYYLLPARMWELMLGAVLATGLVPQFKGRCLQEAAPLLGVVMIASSFFYIRTDMVFPGWVALVPCLGTAMVLHATGGSLFARIFLASPPVVAVGLISYSLYLWHWPILAGLRTLTASAELNPFIAFGGVVASLLIGWFSWRFVEQPFRDRSRIDTARLAGMLGAATLMVAVFAGASVAMGGFPARLDEPARMALAGAADIDPYRATCRELSNREECRFGPRGGPVTYAIVGDSHAAALRPGIEASGIMGDAAGTLYWKTGCPLLDGARMLGSPDDEGCETFKRDAWRALEADHNLETIILAGRWPAKVTGWKPDVGGSDRVRLVDPQSFAPSVEENGRVLQRSLSRTVTRLQNRGLKVIVIGSAPEPGLDVPLMIALSRHWGGSGPADIDIEAVRARAGAADALIVSVLRGRSGVTFLPIWEAFCSNRACDIERGGRPLFYDDDHLSVFGAKSVAGPAILAEWRRQTTGE